eukprot:5526355-Pleurochrysis_carterae.AAC.1
MLMSWPGAGQSAHRSAGIEAVRSSSGYIYSKMRTCCKYAHYASTRKLDSSPSDAPSLGTILTSQWTVCRNVCFDYMYVTVYNHYTDSAAYCYSTEGYAFSIYI